MAQVTRAVAQGILDGQGYTDNEVRQLAFHWLKSTSNAAGAAPSLDDLTELVRSLGHSTRRQSVEIASAVLARWGAAAPAQEAEDAARYRILRRGQHWSVIDGFGDTLRSEVLDAAIDAARARQEGGA